MGHIYLIFSEITYNIYIGKKLFLFERMLLFLFFTTYKTYDRSVLTSCKANYKRIKTHERKLYIV